MREKVGKKLKQAIKRKTQEINFTETIGKKLRIWTK